MPCRAFGRPAPKIRWYKNDEELVRIGSDDRLAIANNGTLSLKNLRLSDAGVYRCVASSESGNASWSASLTVSPGTSYHHSLAPDVSVLPESPSKSRIVNTTSNTVTLTWSPGHEGGAGKIIDYTVEYFATNPKTSWIVAGTGIKDDIYTVRIYIYIYIYIYSSSDSAYINNELFVVSTNIFSNERRRE